MIIQASLIVGYVKISLFGLHQSYQLCSAYASKGFWMWIWLDERSNEIKEMITFITVWNYETGG